MNNEQKQAVQSAVQAASNRWIEGFNSGKAEQCAAAYEKDAVMRAKPFGTFEGREQIQAFWAQLIADGYSDVEYVKPQVEVLDERSALITSKWRMNKAHGVITKELWFLQADGTAQLREDDFEALG